MNGPVAWMHENAMEAMIDFELMPSRYQVVAEVAAIGQNFPYATICRNKTASFHSLQTLPVE